jgi:hypothetical protein
MVILGIVRVFESDKLLSVHILKQINPICLELLIGTLNWSLINTDNISFMFQFKQPVRVYNDETLLGVFYITDSKRESIDKYSINCEDAIGVINDIPIAANMFNSENVKTLIESWINENFHLEIDDSLANYTVTGYIPPSTLRTAIQQVCFAIGAICTSSDTGNIKIYKPDSSNIIEIADDRTFSGGSVETTSAITELRIFAHTYTQTTSPQAGDDIVTIGNLKYIHSTTTETIINPNIKPNVKSKIIEIKEATLVNPTNISNIIEEVYRFYEKVNKHNVSFKYNQEQLGQTVATTTPYNEKVVGILQKIELDENVFLAKSEILY